MRTKILAVCFALTLTSVISPVSATTAAQPGGKCTRVGATAIIKGMKFHPSSLRPIDEVISTVGGISMEAITKNFQLKCYDKVFVCGEMLDWDAPTGGYLIQGCVSSGYKVAISISTLIKG